MLRLTIAEREFRVGARASGTYSSRRNIALAAVLVFFGFYWNAATFGAQTAGLIFDSLSLLAFVYALLAGVILGADAISSEKREGTLGLLFLTALKPWELVAGNVVASSLKAFYGLVAIFPVLGISFILGGLSWMEFGRTCLVLASTLIFSLSVSLLASCASREHLRAASRAACALVFFALGIPLFHELMTMVSPAKAAWWDTLKLLSPSTGLELSKAGGGARGAGYWRSLLAVNSMTVAMLVTTILLLPRVWKDRETGEPGRTARWLTGRTAEGSRRKAVASRNPFYWLATRQRTESARFLQTLLLTGCAAAAAAQLNIAPAARHPVLASQLMAWSFCLASVHAAVLFRVAALATSRLADDRKAGALESILCTPLKVRRILTGQWKALVREMAVPGAFALTIHGLVFWGTLNLWALDHNIAGGARAVWRVALDGIASGSPFELICLCGIILGSAVVLGLDWIALGWMGMWTGLRTRHSAWAVWIVLGVLAIPPVTLYGMVITFGMWIGLARGFNEYWAYFCVGTGLVLGIVNAVAWIAYCWRKLATRFRVAAGDQFVRKGATSWRASLQTSMRFGAAGATVVLLVLLFYGVEKWRGLRAWARVERELTARGLIVSTRAVAPPPVPDAENFGAAELFRPLFDYRYDATGRPVWGNPAGRQNLLNLKLSGGAAMAPETAKALGDWGRQRTADFEAWREYYRTNSHFAGLSLTSMPPAQAVLEALSAFAPELDELEAASRRPLCRFPIHYEESHAAFCMHLPVLRSASEIVQLRASARLAEGDAAAALSDIRFMLRLARALKEDLGIWSFQVRKKIFRGALQPAWEGLREGRWSDNDLKELQQLFAHDFLGEHVRAVRAQTVSEADFYERLAARDEELLRRMGAYPIDPKAARFYPAGWKLLNQAGLFQLSEDKLVPLVNPAAHRVFPIQPGELMAAVRRSRVRFDPVARMIVPWQAEMHGNAIVTTAHAQVAADQAVVACALERFRRARGGLPAKLEELDPDFLERIPCDPMTGKGYRYRTHKEGFTLWSVGWDGKDDDGEPSAKGPEEGVENGAQKGDWVWGSPTLQNRLQ